MAKFKCGHEKSRDNTTPRGRCRECWNAYCRTYHKDTKGPEKRVPVPPPHDLREMAKAMNKTMLRQHYGIGEDRLETWLRETGVVPAKGLCIRRRHLPDDFAEIAPSMSQMALSKLYKVDWTTIKRWKEEAGVETMDPNELRRRNLRREPQQNNRLPSHSFVFKGSSAIPVVRDSRLFTLYDQAADELRRNRWAVHRCDDRGRYCEKGKLWRVGNVICTPDELLQRAARYRNRAA